MTKTLAVVLSERWTEYLEVRDGFYIAPVADGVELRGPSETELPSAYEVVAYFPRPLGWYIVPEKGSARNDEAQ